MKTFKTLGLLGLFLIFSGGTIAQEWFFGFNAGLDFSGGAPVNLNGGQISHQEGVAVQYDCNDNLVLYSSGLDCYDAGHNLIPGGPLAGSTSMTMNLICPKPGSNGNIYYVFYGTPPNAVVGADIKWAEVDMSGPTITSKDNSLSGAIFYEGMTLVAHSNGTDFWLLTHRGNSARFDIYLITAAGIAWNRQESIGNAFAGYSSSHTGYMATSKNNDRIAYAMCRDGRVQAFSFNNGNGDITGTLGTWNYGAFEWTYGVDFSPNGLYLYMGKRAGANTGIHKLNIGTGASSFIYNAGFAAGAVRRAPDDKLYFVETGLSQVGVIGNPNNYGAPALNANAVNTAPNNVGDGLPTLPSDPICTTLPIQLIQFSAIAKDGVVDLNWTTASELNNDFFTIERSSNSFEWEEVLRVQGAGNSSESLKYSARDENPLSGTSYYRLRQTDFDGTSKTFNVEVVNLAGQGEISIQRANRESVLFEANLNADQGGLVEIYNIMGERVSAEPMLLHSGLRQYELKGDPLSAGVYFLKVSSDTGDQYNLKFRVQ